MQPLSVSEQGVERRPDDLVTHLRTLAATRSSDTALIAASSRGEVVISYAELDRRARALAAELQASFEPGDRALLLLDNDEHYVVAFLACLYSGLVAVPAFPPESLREQHVARLRAIAADAEARCVLMRSELLSLAAGASGLLQGMQHVVVDAISPVAADRWQPHARGERDVIFLQYTSGSTATPKGVIVDHGNLLANQRVIQQGLRTGPTDRFVSWLPLFHDMGLVGGLFQPLYNGIPLVLTSPSYFLERPVRWLELITRHRGTISGGPDFAYRLCLERISDQQLESLDLSSWRLAFSGAEPVRHDTLHAFAERFKVVGFDARAIYPCYGLAEATLYVTGGRRGAGLTASTYDSDCLATGRAVAGERGTMLVGCGTTQNGHRIEIVDPRTRERLSDGRVGEVWASGPSVSRGYWRRERETAETFIEQDGVRWLRTGDLGFVDQRQLYITGRHKDLIILRGQNIYPQDIERAIETGVEAVRKGRAAAFAVEIDGAEGIGVAVEISRGMSKLIPPQALVDALSAAVSEQCGEAPSVVALLNPGGLPKTSSGKLQRSACRKGWQERSLDAYALYERGRFLSSEASEPVGESLSDLESQLASLWRSVLKQEDARLYSPSADFFALGGNSLTAAQLAGLVSERWRVPFAMNAVFEQPRLRELAAEIGRLVTAGVRDDQHDIVPLSAERRLGPVPLSHTQQRLWFLWKLDPASTAYHIQVVLRLTGALNIEVLRATLAALSERHESLRTVFQLGEAGEVVQLVSPRASWSLELIDWSPEPRDVATDRCEIRIANEIRALNTRPFDLTQGPLVRAALIRCVHDVHRLVLVMHHIVSDGTSMQILIDELAADYRERLAGVEPHVPTAQIQYADYAAWQRGSVDEQRRERLLAWWRRELEVDAGEEIPVLRVPTDRPRQPVARHRAAQYTLELPASLTNELRGSARVHGTTLFMTLLAGFQALLHRYTGQRDIRIGVPIANRARPELQRVIGAFVNTVVVRTVIDGRMRLAQILARAKQAVLGAQSAQEIPFEHLVEALQPERSLSHTPLFQVLFNHLIEDRRSLESLPGLTAAMESAEPGDAQFELSLEARERSDGTVAVTLIYAAELFDAASMERLAEHYVAMLRAVAERSELAVSDVLLLGEHEIAKLNQWGANPRRYEDVQPVHSLIERQVARTPDATALEFGENKLSYAQLNHRANQIAHRLISMGVRPDSIVGLALERSIEMVVGLLAVMKAGGAYVPLDLDYPAERLEYMVKDSGCALVLTHRRASERVTVGDRVRVVALDTLDVSSESGSNPRVALHGENLAYVIYTSGSTGRPKGASNRHLALHNRLRWMQEAYRLDTADTVLQKTPFGFDVSVWEFFWPLMAGARLAMARPGDHRDPARLVELIRQHQVTTVHFVPSMLQAFLTHRSVETCDSVKRIVCSGEALPAEVRNQLFERLPRAELYNLYGPTEAAIDVTHWTCRNDASTQVPIGQPIANIATVVLDENLNLCPTGVPGELYLGGIGLARGYLNRAGLTAGRFVADPFDRLGGRLYRTGDLVRWNAAGQLEYLGRLDHQVKLRGLRIELGEIEAQLLAQADVREAVVVARSETGGTQLTGYVSTSADHAIDVSALRARLSRLLPDYMVPSAIVVLDSLPLNANGKVDRKALPRPELVDRRAYEAPRGEVAETLATIWGEVLGIDTVSAGTSFFDLGGHSLQLIRVHRLLEERLQTRLTLIDLFKYPTVSALAKRIEAGSEDVPQPTTVTEDDARQVVLRREVLARRRHSVERVG